MIWENFISCFQRGINSGKGNSRCKGQVKEARGHDGDKIVRETKQLGQTEVERLANAEQEGILFTVLISLNLMLETTTMKYLQGETCFHFSQKP